MRKSVLVKIILGLIVVLTAFSACKKNSAACEGETATGRIIGYHPCDYFTPSNNKTKAGFVVEISNAASKDTVLCFNLPTNSFSFPEVDGESAANGNFLYEQSVQDQLKIRFHYRLLSNNEKTLVLCNARVYTAPILNATKGKEISITCFEKQ